MPGHLLYANQDSMLNAAHQVGRCRLLLHSMHARDAVVVPISCTKGTLHLLTLFRYLLEPLVLLVLGREDAMEPAQETPEEHQSAVLSFCGRGHSSYEMSSSRDSQ